VTTPPLSNRSEAPREDHDVKDRVYQRVIRAALGLFWLLDLRFAVDGEEHIPDVGGAVLASNHVSYLDFTFVGLAAHPKRRFVRFMAKKAVFDSKASGWLMRGMHHIPVDLRAGASAYAEACTALREGELVGVFPESTISRAFVPRTLKSGAARMALEADVPLLPVAVWGGQRLWTTGRKPRLRRGVPIVIKVGPPIDVTGAESADALTEVLHEQLTKLVEDVQRAYPAPTSETELWWQPAYLGGSAPTLAEAKPIEAASSEARRHRKKSPRKGSR
jgi:1-acyl-sn-glycerol-3-phosphate acyltransferase